MFNHVQNTIECPFSKSSNIRQYEEFCDPFRSDVNLGFITNSRPASLSSEAKKPWQMGEALYYGLTKIFARRFMFVLATIDAEPDYDRMNDAPIQCAVSFFMAQQTHYLSSIT